MNHRFSTHEDILSVLSLLDEGRSGPILYQTTQGRCYTDSEAFPHHYLVTGQTRSGKSTRVSLNTLYSILHSGDCAIVLDSSKGDLYRSFAPYAAQVGSHQLYHLNFADPFRSPHSYNPIYELHWKLHHEDSRLEEDARKDADLLRSLVAVQSFDKFWESAAGDVLVGLTLALLELADDESQLNLLSLQAMLSDSLHRIANTTVLKELVEFMPTHTQAKHLLSTMSHTAHQTAGSIYAVVSNAVNRLCTSTGLIEMTAGHSLSCQDLSLDKPFLIFITLPPEDISLPAIVLSQITAHFARQAERCGGRLPRTLWCIVEEMGVVGKYLPNLPQNTADNLGRGIRYLLVCQSAAQLDSIYGAEGARIIRDNTVNINFANQDPLSLRMLSDMCGTWVELSEQGMWESPVLRPEEIAALGVGQALIRCQNLTYVTQLPIFTQFYTPPKWQGDPLPARKYRYYRPFHLEEYVMELRKRHLDAVLNSPEKGSGDRFSRDCANQVYNHLSRKKPWKLDPSIMAQAALAIKRRGELPDLDDEDDGPF